MEAWGCVMCLNCRFTVLVSFAFHKSKRVAFIYRVRDNVCYMLQLYDMCFNCNGICLNCMLCALIVWCVLQLSLCPTCA